MGVVCALGSLSATELSAVLKFDVSNREVERVGWWPSCRGRMVSGVRRGDESVRSAWVDMLVLNSSKKGFCSAFRIPYNRQYGVLWGEWGLKDLEFEDFEEVGDRFVGDEEEVILHQPGRWILRSQDELQYRLTLGYRLIHKFDVSTVSQIPQEGDVQCGRRDGWIRVQHGQLQ
jgi:hypothetical protein